MNLKMKICQSCKIKKPLGDFHVRGRKREGTQHSCMECDVERTRNYRQRTRRLLGRWKVSRGCQICGFKAEHSCQLDIDHIDRLSKDKRSAGRAIDPSWAYDRIKQQLSGCQVLCKNCHSVKTYQSKDHLA